LKLASPNDNLFGLSEGRSLLNGQVTRDLARSEEILSLLQHPESCDRWDLVRELHSLGERHTSADGGEVVYSYRLCQEALRSPFFVKGGVHVSSTSSTFTDAQREQLRAEAAPEPGFLSSLDDPDHARLRRLVSLAFSARAVEQYRESVRIALDHALSAVDPHASVNLVDAVCRPIPQYVIGQLVGVPLPDREAFADLARRNSAGQDPATDFDVHLDSVRARRIMFDYIAGVVSAERRQPSKTPLGQLVSFQHEGGEITDDELITMVTLLYTAGFRTTVMMLANGTVELLKNPEAAQAIRSDITAVRAVTDEVLRYEPPTMSVANLAADGAELGGVAIAAGTRVTALIGAANRDPRAFADPDLFDVARLRDRAPMTFGLGAHYCLGAALTKIEGDEYFAELTARFPRMQLVEDPRRAPSFRFNTYDEVRVILDPR
jgi:cytochrome P450